ncbi:MAG TPA: efflux RND transporter periplasmic adaptor subunit [Gammaproteobacteria bacterium]|nr:efflux RND transporter periplasmic adaptor subunit [Gammaproteobacteria bacterium]
MSFDQSTLDSLKIDRNAPSRPSGGARGWIVALVLVVVAGGAGAYWLFREKPIEVELATAVAAPAASAGASAGAAVLNASGYVVARREATVSAKVTGKIAAVLIEEGMIVEEGQLLAQLDDQTLRPLLDLAETQLEASRAELDEVVVRRGEADRELRRLERLRAENLSSERDVDRARSEVDALAARFARLERAVDVAEATVRVRAQEIEDLEVRAPFAGVIVSKDAQPGEMVSPISAGGGFTRTGIATLVDMDSREIEVDVNESFINRVRAEQKTEAVLDAYPDWVIPSHVINIVPTADRQKATVKVRIAFDELDPRILSNMGVKVTFLDSSGHDEPSTSSGAAPGRPAVRLPASAVQRDGGTSFVWRVRGDRAERVAVRLGAERSGQVEVVAGINAGDVVVDSPPAEVAEGAAVVAAAR